LRKHGSRLKLAEQPFQALAFLVERAGQLVTREELQKRLWQDGVFVDFERGINKVINRLREILGDDADNPKFIETLPQRGYRFIGEIVRDSPPPSNLEVGQARVSAATTAPPLALTASNSIGRRALFAGLTGSAALISGLAGWRWFARREINSIAVLPLDNLSGDPAQDFLADGMTDELIGELAKIRSLRVISRTSVMRYKGPAKKPLPQIARELHVDAIVEGSVARDGAKVRITAQLIRAIDDRHIWAERYEREMSDVLRLQNEVSRAIAVQVRRQVTVESKPLRQVYPEAQETYMKAYASLFAGPTAVPRSIELFRRTLELDPDNADAYAGLAEALTYAGIFSFRPTEETYPEARSLAQRALELDGNNAPAHNVLADVKKGYDWNLKAAEAEYRLALDLNPSHLVTRLWLAEMWSRLGRFDEALAEYQRAGTLDPVSPNVFLARSMVYWRASRFSEAIAAAQTALDMAPGLVNALWWQGLAHTGNREFTSALLCLRRAESMNPGPMTLGYLGYVLAVSGQRAQAQNVLARLQAMSETRYVGPVDFAAVYAGLGDVEAAFKWLEIAFKRRNHGVHLMRTPLFDGFRNDSRYPNFLRRTGVA
jgi:TolB-like protein/DNA-binding winged helix-turn-helix (wHTH) protein/Flp pilus assembly protein TadD